MKFLMVRRAVVVIGPAGMNSLTARADACIDAAVAKWHRQERLKALLPEVSQRFDAGLFLAPGEALDEG